MANRLGLFSYLCWTLLMPPLGLSAQDWSQWRGANRDGKVAGFTVATHWPKELTFKWRKAAGLGEATPALVGERLFVFGRQGDEEAVLCLQAANGEPLWRYAYPAVPVTGAAEKYQGPRSSPAVSQGKVVTLGVGGTELPDHLDSEFMVHRFKQFACSDIERGSFQIRNSRIRIEQFKLSVSGVSVHI